MENNRHVFLIATHVLTDRVRKMYTDIQQSVSGYGDVFILYNQASDEVPPSGDMKMSMFRNSILQELHYTPIENTLIPGSNHFSLLYFYLNHAPYSWYWYIEYDAIFNGDWQVFFDAFKNLKTDFITSRIEPYGSSMVRWHWWETLNHPQKNISREHLLSSFNPVYRISARALKFIHEALLDHWKGHHEVLLPTLLYNNDFTIMDFGGKGRFAPPSFRDKLYAPETYRHRPAFSEVGKLKNKLYHPVK